MKYIYGVSFLAFLSIPLFFLVIGVNLPKVNVIENRVLTPKPNFHETSFSKLSKEYENYLTDHLSFRTQFIAKYMQIWEMGLSSFVRKNVKGIENHYFPNFKAAPTINRYLGFDKLPLQKLYLFRNVIAGRQAFWQSYDATYLFMLLPDKDTLYPEFLPAWIKNKYSWFDQLNGILINTEINYLDANKILENKKNTKTPFFNKVFDIVHWNGNALDVMYKIISKKYENNPDYYQIDGVNIAYTIQHREMSAGLFGKEIVPWIELNKEALRVKKNKYKGFNLYPWFSCDIIINEKLKRGTLLFATDSYFKRTHQDTLKGAKGAIFPFVHNVHKLINVHYTEKFSILKDIAQNERPNIVIEASAERAGYNITQTAFPRLLIAGDKLLNESQFILSPKLYTPSSKHLNCILELNGNKIEVFAKNNDPILHLPTQQTNKDGRFVVMAKIHSPVNTVAQLFYAQGNEQFHGTRSVSQKIKKGVNYLHLPIYARSNEKIRLRFDPGMKKEKYTIFSMPDTKEMFEEKL